MVLILQNICISSHHNVHLKVTRQYMASISYFMTGTVRPLRLFLVNGKGSEINIKEFQVVVLSILNYVYVFYSPYTYFKLHMHILSYIYTRIYVGLIRP